jgi:nickel/cobalt transporter (NiCoT) family protein
MSYFITHIAMVELPVESGALVLAVAGLGLRHGVDADHLAAIDALTRVRVQAGRPAAHSGLLFAAGHGAVVLAVAAAVGVFAAGWQPPAGLKDGGAWLSVLLLLALGLASLHGLLHDTPVGGRAARLAHRRHAALATGALFALSFDTLALAALFGATGIAHGGAPAAVGFAAVFVAAMALVDGANGWWIARLQRQRRDRPVRALGWLITAFTFGVAGWGLARLLPAATAAPLLVAGLVGLLAWISLRLRPAPRR